MKVLFVYNGTESLGIEYISSLLKSRGHQTFLLFDPAVFSGDVFVNNKCLANYFSRDRLIIKKAVDLRPDVVAFSSYTGNYLWCLGIARAIKQRVNVPVIFGGVHPTAVPEKVLENRCVDFVVAGEGEFAMLDLVEYLALGGSRDGLVNIPNVCGKSEGCFYMNAPRPLVGDLDSLPFPDKALFFDREPILQGNPYLIMTSRGCPYNCSYCSNDMYRRFYCKEKQYVRRRSPDNVMEEILAIKKKKKVRRITFVDDVFTFSLSWLEDFMEKYKSKINLPFFCYAHPLTMTKRMASLLKEGGCYMVGIGVQSGSERVRREIYNRKESNEKIIEAVSCLKGVRIKICLDHIFGAPSETEADLKESVYLFERLKPDSVLPFWLTYYPRTKIIETAKAKGILSEKDITNIEGGHVGSALDTGSVAKRYIPLYTKYELMFRLTALCHNEKLRFLLLKVTSVLPFKKMASLFIHAITGLICHREFTLNRLRYALSRHKNALGG